ncbi:putative LPS assembly protein LptD [Cloacibacterium caeni]|uniref:putative LPS assembly protein LptD n=1 Tax=Cloacibacterium caeni TaxID=2004710 RepID=UPI001BCE2F51|nr:putative LPS assembly protein LptD [Cloacibacterium caeni]
MIKNGLKNTLQILIILIFNNFLAQNKLENAPKNSDNATAVSKTDTVKIERERLDDIVRSKADNIRNEVPKKMSYLNQNAEVSYQDMKINADYIQIDWDKGLIFARGKVDSIGKITEPAVATQGGKKYEYSEFSYNYKTKQAIAYNARTEESEGVIVAEKTKKVNDSVFYLKRGKYTTDEYFLKKKDTIADYYLLAPDIKLVKGKENSKLITGPIQMYIEQVPTPLILPFAILPFSEKRMAGILIPSFGERQDVGFFLNSLGYYLPIGEHFDVKTYFDYYTKGSWNFRPEVSYRKNYKYNGSFRGEIGTTIRGIKGLENYTKSSVYNIAWTHTQDSKANPFFNFSASVNITSNKFYNNTVNNSHIFNQSALNAQQNSTVSFTKRFLNLPITITGTGSYSQNFTTGLTDIRLPQLNVSTNQFYLFKPKTGIRTGMLENITVNTGLQFSNYVSGVKSGDLFTKTMWDNMQTGAKNNIALATNTTVAKFFTFSLGANIDNVATTKTINKNYNPVTNTLERNLNKNLTGYSTFSTSASLQTVLYGMLKFGEKSKIQAIRHMVTPSIGFTYSPDFGDPKFGYFKSYYDERGVLTTYSIFEGGMFGSPNQGLTQSIGFNINNNLEMKVRSKTDSTGTKKVKIFESLNISGGYNFAADKYKWSLISISTQTSFFQNKLSVNSNVLIDPYQIVFIPGQENGIRTENFGHFNIQSFNMNFSFPLNNETFGKKEDLATKYKTKGEIRNEVYYFDQDNYSRFNQPWTLNLNANYGYSKTNTRFGKSVASLGLDGSVKLTPYWSLSGNTHYDFVSKSLAYTRLGFSRDQRSFSFTFNWVPFGQYKVYDFFISIKANILKDAVKYKERSFQQSGSTF